MIPERLGELESEVSDMMRRTLGTQTEYAEHFASQSVKKMVDDGAAIELTEDEERMLRSYRKYRERNASGVFSWSVKEEQPTFVVPETPSLIVDPRDVSAATY